MKKQNPILSALAEWKPFDPVTPTTMTIGARPGAREIAGKEWTVFYRELLGK